ncbi:MAG: GTP-binding protein [Chlamydiales bacterium]|jgi:GTP-binding protein
MPKLPKLAIVGRPNVGKSALFNRICRRRLAIVDEAEGVTRDRLYCNAEFFGMPFEVIDTGGIHAKSQAIFNEEIKRQAEIAIEEADSIVMVVDGRIGLTDLDKEVARILLRTKKPVSLAVNKVDDRAQEHLVHEFYSLGITDIMAVSAEHGWHIAELLELALKDIKLDEEYEKDPSLRIAIVGKPNAGKSTLVNTLLEEERCVVSPIPGTTRDSVDIPFEWNGIKYTLVDTAGIRRKNAEHEVVDKFAAIRTQRAIERCDICVLMLDAQEGLTTQDKKITNDIEKAGKACVLAFNKWDLVKGFRMEHCLKDVQIDAPFLNHVPSLFMSAKTGRNLPTLFEHINEAQKQTQRRISTSELNKFIETTMQKVHPPMITGKRLRVYYLTQVDTSPPHFLLFVNNPLLMTDAYKKYIYNQFRKTFEFTGAPVSFHLKGKKKEKISRDVDRKGVPTGPMIFSSQQT